MESVRKRLTILSCSLLLVQLLTFQSSPTSAADRNHLQSTKQSGIKADVLHNDSQQNFPVDLSHQENKIESENLLNGQLMKSANSLEKNFQIVANTSLGIDCGDDHAACPDDLTCCPLNYKCCDGGSNGLMACCSYGEDVSN